VAQWQWLGTPAISLVLGIFTGGLTVAMSKFELGFIPMRGRAHYVAINVTAVGLGGGAAALAAGHLLNDLQGKTFQFGALSLDRFDVFFMLSAAFLLVPLAAHATLPEERARSLRTMLQRELKLRQLRVLRLLRRAGEAVVPPSAEGEA